jgi:hypothetical protein
MPNWVSTTLSVKGSPTEVQRFIDGIKDSKILESYVPCPTELHETVAGSVGTDKAEEHRKQQESNTAKYGYKDWYDWSYDNWGTKWGDCDTDIGHPMQLANGSWEVVMRYQTAWGPADAGFLKVSTLFPELLFTFDYDEEAGFFAGTEAYLNGASVFESMYEPCAYEGEVDYDDYESIDKYEAWKEAQSDAIFTQYCEFLKEASLL